MTKSRNPLEPTSTFVYMFGSFVVVLSVFGAFVAIFGNGTPFGIGSSSVCVEARNGTVPVPRSSVEPIVLGVRDGVGTTIRDVALCTNAPTAGQQTLGVLDGLPMFLVFACTLVLAVRLFRTARRRGVFDGRIASQLRNIGLLVLFGSLVASAGEAIATYGLVNTMMVDPLGTSWFNAWDLPVIAVFLGFVLISFVRVMRISVGMHEELDETV